MADTLDVTYWEDATGVRHALTDNTSGLLLLGRADFGMPPVERVTQEVPGADGAALVATKVRPRQVELRLRIDTTGYARKWLSLREVLGWFNPLAGPGRLIVQGVDRFERYLSCAYADGLGLDEDPEQPPHGQAFVLVLAADDPWWYDLAPQTGSFQIDPAPAFFPILPVELGAAAVIAAPAITNTGHARAWPVWTVTGPATGATLTNLTTGDALSWTGVLLAGQTLELDTRRQRKTARVLPAGTNVYAQLGTSKLWALEPGRNDLQVVVDGAGDATVVTYTFERPYLSC